MYSCGKIDLFEYDSLQNTGAQITHYSILMRKLRNGQTTASTLILLLLT